MYLLNNILNFKSNLRIYFLLYFFIDGNVFFFVRLLH